MKIFKTILKSIAVLLVGAVAFTSCKNDIENNSEAYLNLQGASIQRSVKAEYEITDFNSYVISGVYSGTEDEIVLGNWTSYSDMVSAYIPIPNTGYWALTMEATKSGTKFATTVQTYITTGENSISFELKPVEYGTEGFGSVKVGAKIKNLPYEVTVSYDYNTGDYEYSINALGYNVVTTCDAEPALSKNISLEIIPQVSPWGYVYSDYDLYGTTEGTFTYTGDFIAILEADDIPANEYTVVFHLNKDSLKDIKKQSVMITVTDEMVAESESEIGYDYNDSDPINGIAVVLDACKYDIIYQLNGGAFNSDFVTVDTYSSLDENDIELPTADDLSKIGYSFAGWYTSEYFYENTYISAIEGNGVNGGDITLYAKWDAINYSITYNFGNGYYNFLYPQNYTVEDTFVDLPEPYPNQSGYEFKGWYTSENYAAETRIRDFYAGDYAEDFILYALYGEISYKINYNTNGGNLPQFYEDEFDVNSDTIILPTPTRDGYNFEGWFTSCYFWTDTKITEVSTGTSEDVAVFANWSIIDYTITYNTNGGSFSTSYPTSYNVTSSTIYLPTPTRSGYNFAGWYTTENCSYGSELNEISAGSTGNVLVWAKWATIGYDIYYYDPDGPSTNTETAGYSAEDLPLTLPTPSKTGYTFDGWYSDTNYYSWDLQTELPIGSTGIQEYYAKWTPIDYTITYNTNGGTITSSYYTTYQITSGTIDLPTVSRVGYDFAGWYTTDNFTAGTEATDISAGTTGDIEYYARWIAQNYSITYNLNEGILPATYPTAFSGLVEIELPEPTRSGYSFEGWYTTDDFRDGTKITSIEVGTISDVEVWAKWIAPATWTRTSNGTYYFTQSGYVWTSSGYSTGTNSISATTTWTITLVQEATVSIPWTVSSESNFDKLTITVDNVTQVNAVSGEKNGTIELTLNAGTHTVTATYSKDTSQYSGSDCGTLTLNPVYYD